MAEYIKREALEKDLNIRLSALRGKNGYYDHYTDGFDECVDRVENFPAADVEEVKHGKWVNIPLNMDPNYFAYKCNLRKKCSVCRYVMPGEWPDFNICPNCGAKMDLED